MRTPPKVAIMVKEADIQRTCLEYLDLKHTFYLRLNSGDVFRPGAAGKMYKVKGCPKGTADLLILDRVKSPCSMIEPRPIFVEFKSSTGKQTPEQAEFMNNVELLGYEYYVIRSLEELQSIC
jgi:hypothetical protein